MSSFSHADDPWSSLTRPIESFLPSISSESFSSTADTIASNGHSKRQERHIPSSSHPFAALWALETRTPLFHRLSFGENSNSGDGHRTADASRCTSANPFEEDDTVVHGTERPPMVPQKTIIPAQKSKAARPEASKSGGLAVPNTASLSTTFGGTAFEQSQRATRSLREKLRRRSKSVDLSAFSAPKTSESGWMNQDSQCSTPSYDLPDDLPSMLPYAASASKDATLRRTPSSDSSIAPAPPPKPYPFVASPTTMMPLSPSTSIEPPSLSSPNSSGSFSTVQDSPSLRSESSLRIASRSSSDSHHLDDLQKHILTPSMLSRKKFAVANMDPIRESSMSTPEVDEAPVRSSPSNTLLLSSLAPPPRRKRAEGSSPWRPKISEASQSSPNLAPKASNKLDKKPNSFGPRETKPMFAMNLRSVSSLGSAIRPSTAGSSHSRGAEQDAANSLGAPLSRPIDHQLGQPASPGISALSTPDSQSSISSHEAGNSYKLGTTFDRYVQLTNTLSEFSGLPDDKTTLDSSVTAQSAEKADGARRRILGSTSSHEHGSIDGGRTVTSYQHCPMHSKSTSTLRKSMDCVLPEVPLLGRSVCEGTATSSSGSQQGRGTKNSTKRNNEKKRHPLRWLRGMNSSATLGSSSASSPTGGKGSGWDDEVIPQTLPLPAPTIANIGLTQRKKSSGRLAQYQTPRSAGLPPREFDSSDSFRIPKRAGSIGRSAARPKGGIW